MHEAPDGPLVSAHGLTHHFSRRRVLDAVDFSVSAREIVSLIGPNGAGKSTLLKILLGIIRPAQGRVIRSRNLRIGYVPQHMPNDPVLPLTVRRMLSLTHRSTRAAQDHALDMVGVRALHHAAMHELSGGERQRVMLARALISEPQLLVLDEPTQGVDHKGEAEIYRLITTLRDDVGFGVVVVSHNLHLVMAATDRVICLDGHVCCAGVPSLVSQHPSYTALFGPQSLPEMALYRHPQHDHSQHDHRHGSVDE
ncbi:MAG: metal ABC transporter ATP-binding protein [Gammaproteobacteria bacterium]|nr:metal ABC transporter ATP-binding protein [Gammaproteobacteria bacterium]